MTNDLIDSIDSHEDLIRHLLVGELVENDTRFTNRSEEEFMVGKTAVGKKYCTDEYWPELKALMGEGE